MTSQNYALHNNFCNCQHVISDEKLKMFLGTIICILNIRNFVVSGCAKAWFHCTSSSRSPFPGRPAFFLAAFFYQFHVFAAWSPDALDALEYGRWKFKMLHVNRKKRRRRSLMKISLVFRHGIFFPICEEEIFGNLEFNFWGKLNTNFGNWIYLEDVTPFL